MGMTELTTHAFEFNPPFTFWLILAVLAVGAGLTILIDKIGWEVLALLIGMATAGAVFSMVLSYFALGSETNDQMLREDIQSQLGISSVVFEGETKWFAGKAEDGSFVRCGMLESGESDEGDVFAVTCGEG